MIGNIFVSFQWIFEATRGHGRLNWRPKTEFLKSKSVIKIKDVDPPIPRPNLRGCWCPAYRGYLKHNINQARIQKI
jgi:hypothetical protein